MRRDSISGSLAGILARFLFPTLVTSASASTIQVPADHPTIQEALFACQAGDTVLVSPGTYIENIIWPTTQSICLRSESGTEMTIIDGSSPSPASQLMGSVILFATPLDASTIIDGFTITGGMGTYVPYYGAYVGGGILCDESSPTIARNVITRNADRAAIGGGIACLFGSSPVITGNTISDNTVSLPAYGIGGGIFCHHGSPAIIENNISGNKANQGCGILLEYGSALVCRNQITSNEQFPGQIHGGGGGILAGAGDSTTIADNVITGNQAGRGAGIRLVSSGASIAGNDITGNIGVGIECTYSYSRASITGNRIIGNFGHGIYCVDSSPEIKNNIISGHAPNFGALSVTSTVVIAENNWWGHATGPYHPILNPGGRGDPVNEWIDFDPWLRYAGLAESAPPPATRVLLARPSPFRHVTTIEYSLPQASKVTLDVYDVLGREVAKLVESVQDGGTHTIAWDARAMPSGVYYCRIEAGEWTAIRPVVLAR